MAQEAEVSPPSESETQCLRVEMHVGGRVFKSLLLHHFLLQQLKSLSTLTIFDPMHFCFTCDCL
jgi:hypothetical protein